MKYNRNYVLIIETNDKSEIRITLPFTLEFEVTRNSFSSANVASFRIYNLAPETRAQIRKDANDTGNIRQISMIAGYGEQLSLGFAGNISQAWSTREGADFVTQIECYDAGFAYVNAVTSQQFTKGTSRESMMQAIMKSLPGVQSGAIGDFKDTIPRGASVSGNSMEVMNEISGGKAFIDNGKMHVLKDDECIESEILVLNASSGLLGTPRREDTYVNIEMIFEPRARVGCLAKLQSVTAEHFNKNDEGIYKIMSIRHRGTISDVVSGVVTSSIGLLPGQFAPVREGS